jgi:hypothetical protein
MSSSRSNAEDVMNMDIFRETAQKPQAQRKQVRKVGSNPGKEGRNPKAQEGKTQLPTQDNPGNRETANSFKALGKEGESENPSKETQG